VNDPGREQPGGERGDGAPQQDADPRSSTRGMAAAYQGAVEAVLAVVIATVFGYWVDGRFATSPTFLLIGLVLGFAAFCIRLWRLRDLMAGSRGQEPKPPESS
jgi:F0F1-type ATP synthase assembly protein I